MFDLLKTYNSETNKDVLYAQKGSIINKSDNTRVVKPIIFDPIKEYQIKEKVKKDNDEKLRQQYLANQPQLSQYDNSSYAEYGRKQNRERYAKNEFLLNNQHLWRVDPTRKVANNHNEVEREFAAQKSLVDASVQGGGLAMTAGAATISVPKTIASIAGAIGGGKASKEVAKQFTNDEGIHNLAEFAGGFAGGIGGWRLAGTKIIKPNVSKYPEIIRAQPASSVGIDKKGNVIGVFRKGEKPLTNTTTDQKVTSHKQGNWDNQDIITINPKAMGKSKVVSIEPTDQIFVNKTIPNIKPKHVTIVTGNSNQIPILQKQGFNVKTSPELQSEFTKQNSISEAFINSVTKSKIDKNPANWQNYNKLLNKELNRPGKSNYQYLESQTGLSSGVIKNQGQSQNILNKYSGKISNLGEPPYFPNNRQLNVSKDLQTLRNINYKKVYYDPSSHAESNLINKFNNNIPTNKVSLNPSYDKMDKSVIGKFDSYLNNNSTRYIPKTKLQLDKSPLNIFETVVPSMINSKIEK